MPRRKVGLLCSIDSCNRPLKGRGFCGKHYQQFYKKAEDYKPRGDYSDRRKHPLYIIWWQRKRDNLLCEKWLDFLEFIKDVEPKPEGNFFLVRLRNDQFGPDNFIWKEHLKKRDDESFRQFWARERAARIAANPSMESERNLKRKYNLTKDQYEEILKSQNFGCAICGEKETSLDSRTGSKRNLAVDHCHDKKHIRGLLCWRCNGTLGKLNDSIELLQSMINYLRKHNGETENV